MANIRPFDLPPAPNVPSSAAFVIDTGAVVQKATAEQVVDSAIPLATQAAAETGSGNETRMSPLRVKQAIDAQALSQDFLAGPDGAGAVGFLQAGAGAQARTLQNKNRDIFSVKDFGAVGDGVANDTAAVQAAANAATGGELFFPAGEYNIAGSVNISAEMNVRGSGATLRQTSLNSKTLALTGVSGATISGLSFIGLGTEPIGAGTSYNGVAGIYLNGCENISVADCTLTNHAGGGIRWTGSGESFRFTGLLVKGVGAAGGIDPLDNTSDFAIGGVASVEDNNIIVSNCDISDHCFGIGLSRGVGSLVIGCSIHDIPGQHGIYASSQGGFVVVGNTFSDIVGEAVKNQISSTGPSYSQMNVSGNVFRNIGQSCCAFNLVSGGGAGRSSGIIVGNNVADNVGNYFASINACDGADFIANHITNCGAAPFQLADWRGRVAYNHIENADWYGWNAEINGPSSFENNTLRNTALNASGAATALRYQTMAYIRNHAATGVGFDCIVKDNVFRKTGSPTFLTRSLRTHPDINVLYMGGNDTTGLGMQLDKVVHYTPGHSPDALNSVTAAINPTTPIYGRGRRELFGTQSPSAAGMADAFVRGDVCWNTQPASAGFVGWVCTVAGAPGTWAGFGVIS